MAILLPVLTGVICMVSFFLTLRDMEKWTSDKQTESKIGPVQNGTVPTSLWIYSALAVVATVTIAALFPRMYPTNPVWVNIKRMCLLAVIWPLAYIDYKTYRIPNLFIVFGIICRVIIFIFELLVGNEFVWTNLASEAIAAGSLLAAALLCALIVKNGLGFGDMKLFVVMGLMLGLEGIWGAIFLSLLAAFAAALILLITKKKTRKDAIPFGPALVLGTFLSVALSGM